jgi:metal-dependent hydrolase (beta-lactamase superfamily II)
MGNQLQCGELLWGRWGLSVLVEAGHSRIRVFMLDVEYGHVIAQAGQTTAE